MSNKIDVLAVMDSAIMRNGHRGDNLGELAMQQQARDAVAELIEAAKEVADEHMGVVAGCKYDSEDDEVGCRVCCGVLSYEDHEADCSAVRLREALTCVGGTLGK